MRVKSRSKNGGSSTTPRCKKSAAESTCTEMAMTATATADVEKAITTAIPKRPHKNVRGAARATGGQMWDGRTDEKTNE